MKTFCVLCLAALMLLAVSCSNDKGTTLPNEPAADYNIIGDDAPQNVDAAMQELSAFSISVPDPVQADDPAATQVFDARAALTIVNNAALDDSGRVNFRRIVAHLHDQMQALRRCAATNDDPRLRRLAYGATQAIRQGLRALQNGEPRAALRLFHTANRLLNLANNLCQQRG